MRFITAITAIIVILTACQPNVKRSNEGDDNGYTRIQAEAPSDDAHAVEILEVVDAGSYTYVRVREKGSEFWAAITARPVEIGKTYYYSDGFMMHGFESKQLQKTFDSVMFIQEFSDQPFNSGGDVSQPETKMSSKATLNKKISVETPEGGITLEDLFSKRESYNGKEISVKGEVVKINRNILGWNWIHIQDGTGSDGNLDLTVTTEKPVGFNVGDVVTLKGIITLNKDFGAGYKYEVIMEQASKINTKEL